MSDTPSHSTMHHAPEPQFMPLSGHPMQFQHQQQPMPPNGGYYPGYPPYMPPQSIPMMPMHMMPMPPTQMYMPYQQFQHQQMFTPPPQVDPQQLKSRPPHTERTKIKFDAKKSQTFIPSKRHAQFGSQESKTSAPPSASVSPLISKTIPHTQDTPLINGGQKPTNEFSSDKKTSRSASTASAKTPLESDTTPSTPSSSSSTTSDDGETPLTSAKSSMNNGICTQSPVKELVYPEEPAQTNTNSSSFKFQNRSGSMALPLLVGTSAESFAAQRKSYLALKEIRRVQDKKKELNLHQKNTQLQITEKKDKAGIPLSTRTTDSAREVPAQELLVDEVKEKTPEPRITPEIVTTSAATVGVTSPTPSSSSVMTGWAAMASQAAKKLTPKSTTASPATPVTVKKEERMVPAVSNVLEPVGVVTLRYMFDKNFLKLANAAKLPKIVPRGLVNTGNICFMSSIVQMLLYCQPFYRALYVISSKTIQSLNRENSSTPLFDALVSLYGNFNIKLSDNKEFGDAITPTEFYRSISKNERFQHLQWGQQEDAEEFFGYLLDGLHEEFTECVKKLTDFEIRTLLNSTTDDVRNTIKSSLRKFQEDDFNSSETSGRADSVTDDGWQEVSVASKKTAKRTVEVKPSPIRQLFGGQFRSVLTIPKSKESQSITLDPFQQIQLDISDENVKTLEDAFVKLAEVEEIPYKSTDGSDVLAKKQTFIDRFPEVLVVHLKRFSFASNRRIEKLRKKIVYPHNLRIPESCISPSTRRFQQQDINYKLTAVVYHHGMSSDGGHYTVDTLRAEGDWINIDDTNITSLELDDVLAGGENDDVKTAYILVYQKV